MTNATPDLTRYRADLETAVANGHDIEALVAWVAVSEEQDGRIWSPEAIGAAVRALGLCADGDPR